MIINTKYNLRDMVYIIDDRFIHLGEVNQITTGTDNQGEFALIYTIEHFGVFLNRPENEIFANPEEAIEFARKDAKKS